MPSTKGRNLVPGTLHFNRLKDFAFPVNRTQYPGGHPLCV